MDDGIRDIRQLPDLPWIVYERLRHHSELKAYVFYIVAGMANLFLLALYISAVIWIVRGLT
jgi:hypothetical protein